VRTAMLMHFWLSSHANGALVTWHVAGWWSCAPAVSWANEDATVSAVVDGHRRTVVEEVDVTVFAVINDELLPIDLPAGTLQRVRMRPAVAVMCGQTNSPHSIVPRQFDEYFSFPFLECVVLRIQLLNSLWRSGYDVCGRPVGKF
jgi:hypothetical protein